MSLERKFISSDLFGPQKFQNFLAFYSYSSCPSQNYAGTMLLLQIIE